MGAGRVCRPAILQRTRTITIFRPVLSISTCSGPLGNVCLVIDASLIARLLTMVWSGTASSRPSNSTTDIINPSAWRSTSLKAVRSIRQVWIALSE